MESINTKLTVNELNLILEALGNMPYYRVHELIHNIHSQAQEQLNGMSKQRVTATLEEAPFVAKSVNGMAAG